MRLMLLAAVVAVGVAVYLLLAEDPVGRRDRENPCGHGCNGETPELGPLPDPGKMPREFVEACVERKAVDELIAKLNSGQDIQLLPRWVFTDKGLPEFPTLRSIFITALGRIEGPEAAKALRKVLAETKSLEESYLLVFFLAQRKESGWEAVAIERAAAEAPPHQRDVRVRLLRAAVNAAPAEAADQLVLRAPRGKDLRAPRVMARGLAMLPAGQAEAATQRLLADREVTPAAKTLYMQAYLQREETTAVMTLTALAERRALDERTSTDAAYAVANAGAFQADRVAYQRAVAAGDAKKAAQILDRNRIRVREARRFIRVALDIDLDTSDDKRAAALKRLLDHHELK